MPHPKDRPALGAIVSPLLTEREILPGSAGTNIALSLPTTET